MFLYIYHYYAALGLDNSNQLMVDGVAEMNIKIVNNESYARLKREILNAAKLELGSAYQFSGDVAISSLSLI